MAFASKITQCNGVQERRRSHVPIGRPRKGSKTERAKLKSELTPYGKKLEASKTKKKETKRKTAGKKATKTTVKKIVAKKKTATTKKPVVSKKTEDAAKEAYARRRTDSRRKLSVFKKDLKPFLTRFDKAYSALYSSKDLQDTRNGPEIYNRLVDRGDKLIKAHPQEVAEFNRTRGDKLSSDREVAAFACAWDHVRITEPKGAKKKTSATKSKESTKLPAVRTQPEAWQVEVLKGPIAMDEDDRGHLVIRKVPSGSKYAMDKRVIFEKLRSSGKKPVVMRPNELFKGRFMDRGAALRVLQSEM